MIGAALLLLSLQESLITVHEAGIGYRASVRPLNLPPERYERSFPFFVARTDTWVPFTIDLQNEGAAFNGTLTLQESFPVDDHPIVTRKRVALAEGARQRITFPVLFKAGASLVVSMHDDRAGDALIAGGRRFDIPMPRVAAPTTPLILVAGAGKNLLTHLLRRHPGGSFLDDRYVIPMAPESLPDHAMAYHGVNLLVLNDVAPDELSTAQMEAIQQYVAWGGRLVLAMQRVFAGGGAGTLEGSPLGPMLPGLPGGISNAASIPALRAATGFDCTPAEPAAVISFIPRPNAVDWGGGVILHRPYEHGLVIACGLPLTAGFLEKWDGSPLLMETFRAEAADPLIVDPGAYQPSPLRTELAKALKDAVVKPIPSFPLVIGLMAGYFVLVGVIPYAVFRRLGRVEWAWGAILTLAMISAAGIYGMGATTYRRESEVVRLSLVEGGSEPGIRLRRNFWAYFSSEAGEIDVDFEDGGALPVPLQMTATTPVSEFTPMTVSRDGAPLRTLRTHTQDSVLFETTDRERMPGAVRFDVTPGGGLSATLGPPARVHHAWLVDGLAAGWVRPTADGSASVVSAEASLGAVLAEVRADPDRLLSKCAPVVLLEASRLSSLRETPLLVYFYEGTRALKGAGPGERSLDVGLIAPSGWGQKVHRQVWNVRRLSPPAPGGYEPDLVTENGLNWELILEDTVGGRIKNLNIKMRSDQTILVELWNSVAGKWVAVNEKNAQPGNVFAHTTPLGTGLARLRMRSDRTKNGTWYVELDSVSSDLEVMAEKK